MSDSLTKKVGIIGATRIVATSLNLLVVSMFLSRHLGQAEYGTFQQTWFFTHMILEIGLLGTPIGILYFLPKLSRPEAKGFLIRLMLSLACVGAIVGAALYSAAPLLASFFGNPALEQTLRIFSFYAILVLPGLPLDSFLIAKNRHGHLGILTILHSVLLVTAVILPSSLGLSLSAVLWCVVGYGLIKSALLGGAAAHSVRGVSQAEPKGLLRPFLAYSIPVGVNDLLRVLSRWLDKNIVSAVFTPETFAIYANGAIEIPFVGVFAGAISAVVIPEFSRLSEGGDRKRLVEVWHRAILKTGAILIPLFVFLLAVATDLMMVLFSETYRASAGPFRVYLVLLPLRCATYTPILLALGRSKLVAVGALLDLLVNLGLSLLLIPRFGYFGPAIATVVTTYGQAAFYLWRAGAILALPLGGIFPWSGILRLFGLAILPASLLALLPILPGGALVRLLTAGVLYFTPMAILLWRYGPLSDQDRNLVRRLWSRLVPRR